jgi:hypothetical protein
MSFKSLNLCESERGETYEALKGSITLKKNFEKKLFTPFASLESAAWAGL